MEMDALRQFLTPFIRLSDEAWARIEARTGRQSLRRGEYYLREGQVCRRLGFITEGVCRYTWTHEQGQESTRYFVQEGQFLSAVDSFSSQTPSESSIQAVTPCEVLTLFFESYQALFNEIPGWGAAVHRITEAAMMEKMQRIAPMIQQDARTRYEQLMRTQPDLLRRVPLGYIASYLGITPQSLSRLRRERPPVSAS